MRPALELEVFPSSASTQENPDFDAIESAMSAHDYNQVDRLGEAFIDGYPHSAHLVAVKALINSAQMRLRRAKRSAPAATSGAPASP